MTASEGQILSTVGVRMPPVFNAKAHDSVNARVSSATQPNSRQRRSFVAAWNATAYRFFPWFVYENLKPDGLEPAEHKILSQFRKIYSDDLKRLAIQQVKLIAETDIKDFKENRRKEIANNPPIDN